MASASAIIAKRDDTATCTLVLTPSASVDPSTNLVAEFNFVIGRALSGETGSGIEVIASFFGTLPVHILVINLNIDAETLLIQQLSSSFPQNDNGTYTVVDTISADGLTTAQTASDIEGWVGQTEIGIAANWLVTSVACA